MSEQKPTVGRMVHFKPSQDQQNRIDGNKSEILPATIVRVWGENCVNLKVHTDAINDLWIKSALKGDGEGQWNWPVIQN